MPVSVTLWQHRYDFGECCLMQNMRPCICVCLHDFLVALRERKTVICRCFGETLACSPPKNGECLKWNRKENDSRLHQGEEEMWKKQSK